MKKRQKHEKEDATYGNGIGLVGMLASGGWLAFEYLTGNIYAAKEISENFVISATPTAPRGEFVGEIGGKTIVRLASDILPPQGGFGISHSGILWFADAASKQPYTLGETMVKLNVGYQSLNSTASATLSDGVKVTLNHINATAFSWWPSQLGVQGTASITLSATQTMPLWAVAADAAAGATLIAFALLVAYRKSESFRNGVNGVWKAMKR